MSSDRCTYNLSSRADQLANAKDRQRISKAKLIADIVEVNHASVHPLNVNYLGPDAKPSDAVWWAERNGLLTKGEIADYNRILWN